MLKYQNNSKYIIYFARVYIHIGYIKTKKMRIKVGWKNLNIIFHHIRYILRTNQQEKNIQWSSTEKVPIVISLIISIFIG